MTSYAKYINENEIDYAPSIYQSEEGLIVNFDADSELLLKHGYKPLEEPERPDHNPEYQVLLHSYSEEDSKIVLSYVVQDNLDLYKSNLLRRLESWYSKQQQHLLEVSSLDCYVKLEWFTTYSNAYQALKFAEAQSIPVVASEVIVLDVESKKYRNITVESSSDLEPLYEAVLLKYNEVVPKRNRLMVAIQDATSVEDLHAISKEL